MADNNEESIRREAEARDNATKKTDQLASALDDLIERNKSAEDKLKKLNKELDTGKKRLVDIGPALESLRESLDDVTDAGEKARISKEIERKESQAKSAQYNRLIVDSAMALASGLASAGVNITKSVINSYQSNASAFQTAGDIAVAGLDASNQTVKGFAAAASTAGAGLMFLGPQGIAAGLALQGIAAAASFLSDKFTDLAKFGVNVAVKELENTTKSFAAASAAGALFSQGMGEMRRLAGEAGLTQEQYAKVIAENAGTFAMFGGSVGAGAQQFIRINKAMAGYQSGLLKLGYSIEEIADGTAQYMAVLAASGQGNRRDYANLARETDAYLTNLRVISAFTGEDAKKKMEQARNASMQLAIDTRIRNMEAAGDKQARTRFMSTIGILPDKMQKAAMQIAEVGSITDPELAAAFYNNKEAMMVLNDAVNLFKTNNLSANDATQRMIATQKIAQKTAFESNKDFNTALGRSTLAIGANAGTTAAAEEARTYLLKQQIDGTKSATETVEEQKKNTDKLSVETAEATKQMQRLRIEIQKELTPAITAFADISKEILEGVRQKMRDLGFGTKPESAPKPTFEETGGGAAVGGARGMRRRSQRPNVAQEDARVENTNVPMTQDDLKALGLKIKQGDVQKAGAKLSPQLIELAKSVQSSIPGFSYISGLNDNFHNENAKGSEHVKGLAMDFVLNYRPTKEEGVKIVDMLKGMGASYAKDEYNFPSPGATGDHIHAEVKAAQGAVVPATTGGTNVLVGEGGSSEVIAPLKNGRLPGMDEMIERLDQMISVMKDHRDTSEKIFNATA